MSNKGTVLRTSTGISKTTPRTNYFQKHSIEVSYIGPRNASRVSPANGQYMFKGEKDGVNK